MIYKGDKMKKESKNRKNIIFVSLFIGTMLIFMLGTVIYVTSQVANCSSVKKAKEMCFDDKSIKNKLKDYILV